MTNWPRREKSRQYIQYDKEIEMIKLYAFAYALAFVFVILGGSGIKPPV